MSTLNQTIREWMGIFLLLSIAAPPLHCQNVLTFSSVRTQGGEVKACEAIHLQPGFSFTANASNTLVMKVDAEVCTSSILPFSPTANSNYIVSVKPMNGTKSVDISSGSITLDKNTPALVRVDYYDGLGRPTQTVDRGICPSGKDLVTLREYDEFGRENRVSLPAVSRGDGGMSPSLKIDVSNYFEDGRPYSETIYEPSPLNRVSAQFGPGEVWKTNNRAVHTEYLANSTSTSSSELNCGKYYVSGNNLVRDGNYSSGSLYVTKMTDENNNVSYEFKDKLDRVVLQRQVAGTGTEGYHDTYYVYDDLGNLCFVLPPLAADATKGGTYSETSDPIKNYAYLYRYDNRNRCKEKKLPGAEWIYMVYDRTDRLILSQDGVQRLNNQWTFRKYDSLGRLIMSGTKPIYSTRADLETIYKDKLIVEKVDANGLHFYTNSEPLIVNVALVLLVNYYDNYLWNNQYKCSPNLPFKAKAGFDANYSSAQGLLTGSLYKLLDDPTNEMINAYYYDVKGNMVQQRSRNHLNGMDYTYYAYNFTNQPLKKCMEHTSPGITFTEDYVYDYDNEGRLKSTTHQVNGGKVQLLASYTYNELGQCNKKITGGIETAIYDYNVRGWLENHTGNKFNEKLYYTSCPQRGDVPGNFNGNISCFQWRTSESNTPKGKLYFYDQLNRVQHEFYVEGDNLSQNRDRYNEHMTYDKHGNMKSIFRKGRVENGSFNDIDILDFRTYKGNQLESIHDYCNTVDRNDLMEFHNGNYEMTFKYAYDANGNLDKDISKKISKFYYNYLNLCRGILFQSNDRIEYLYDASGVKQLEKHIGYTTGTTVVKDYIDNKVYENGVLKRVLTDEGYLEKVGNDYAYYFFLKDYLGSNRMVLNSTGGIVQATNYYAFGLSYAESPARTDQQVQPYKFGGKELDRMYGLDAYDFGARMYNPSVGRFMTMDPLAEKYYSISPYAYCANNPVRFIDTDGRKIVDTKGNVIYQNGQWLGNAAEGAKLIGNNMNSTSVGREAFNNLEKANYGVELVYDKTTDIGKIGESIRTYGSNGETTKATITVFEKNLVGELNNLTEVKNSGKPVINSLRKNQEAMLKEGIPTKGERIGQVGVHEAEHVLNPKAWKSAGGNYENIAIDAEIKAIKETNMNKPLPLPDLKVPKLQFNNIQLQ